MTARQCTPALLTTRGVCYIINLLPPLPAIFKQREDSMLKGH